jgi:hypothetical protein
MLEAVVVIRMLLREHRLVKNALLSQAFNLDRRLHLLRPLRRRKWRLKRRLDFGLRFGWIL